MRYLRFLVIMMALGLGVNGLPMVAMGAEEDPGLKGWGEDSEYNRLYKAEEMDQFKGVVESINDITPMPGMAAGIGVTVRDQDGDTVLIHLGPKTFVKPESINLAKGDKVKVRGSWADLNGKEIFLASKIKKGEYTEIKVRRTSDGAPYWTMSADQLAKERQE